MKKCPYCFTEIDDRASLCPNCRKKVGSANRKGIARKHISIFKALGIILMLFIIMGIFGEIIGRVKGPEKLQKYTQAQKKVAQSFFDETVNTLMKEGLIKEITGEGKLQIVYVSSPHWNLVTYENKKEFLGNLSKSNEILGYTPWFEIRDYRTGEVYAAIKPPLTYKVYK